jgi:hypothetical protein
MREEFEAWGLANYFEVGHKSADGGYLGAATGIAWMAWQASRAAVVVELPNMIGLNQPFTGTPISEIRAHNHFNDAIKQCRKAIESTGIRVK